MNSSKLSSTHALAQKNRFSGHNWHWCFHLRRFQTFVFSRASLNVFCNNILVQPACACVCVCVMAGSCCLSHTGCAKVSRTSCVTESIDLTLCLIFNCQIVYHPFLTQISVISTEIISYCKLNSNSRKWCNVLWSECQTLCVLIKRTNLRLISVPLTELTPCTPPLHSPTQ